MVGHPRRTEISTAFHLQVHFKHVVGNSHPPDFGSSNHQNEKISKRLCIKACLNGFFPFHFAGHAAISPSFPADSQITTPTEPFDKTLHEQLFVAKADGQKAWAEVEAGRQRLAQLEEKLLAGRSLFARQEDLFRDLRKEVDEGKTRLETQAEAFREVREELLAAREELDVSRRLLRQMVPGVERKDAESWVAGKEREKKGEREGADLEGEKGVFGGQLLRGDDEPPERGEWSPQQGETNGDQGATFVDQTNGAHVDRKDCAGEVGDDVSKESMRARAGSSEEHGEPLTGWAEETEENQVEVPELRVEAERDVQFEGRAVAGGTTSAAGVRKAGEHSDWDAIERESELLLRSIEQAHGEGDASGIASGDESVNGVSDAGVNGQREGDIHWVGEESASGPGEGVNRLQVGSVNGRPSESVAESTSSVQGHVGATSAPRETASVEPSEVGKSREVGKEEGYRWESAEEDSEEEAAGPSFVKLTGLPGEQERRRPSESRSMQSSSPNPAVCDKSSSPQESPAGRDPPSRSSKAAPANRLPAVSNTETQSADLPPETLPSEQLSLTTVTTGGPESDAGRKTRRESNASDETARESGLATELGRGKRNRNGAEAESPASGATEGDSIADVIAILGDEATLCHEADAGWPPGGDAGPRPKAKGPLQMVQRRASEAEKGLGEEVRGSGRPEPMGEKVSSAKGSNDVWRTENRVTKLFQRDQNGEAEGFARERLGVNYGRGKGVQTGSAPKTEKKSDRPVSGNGNVAEASLPFTKRRPVGYDANAVLRRVRKREKREREALREIRAANGTEPESGVPGKTGTNRQQLRDGGVGSTTLGKEVRSRKVMRASRRMSPFGDPNVLKPVRSTGAGRGLQEDGLSLQQGCPEIKIAEVSVLAAGKPKVDLPLNSELVRKRDDGMVGLRVSELHRERSKLQLALAMKHAQRAAAGLGIEA